MAFSEKPIADNKFGKKTYLSADGLEALIIKIAALRKNLQDADSKVLADATAALDAAVENLNKAISDNSAADAERLARIEALETWKGEHETAFEEYKTSNDAALAQAVADAAAATKTVADDLDAYKTTVNDQLDQILAAFGNIVTADEIAADTRIADDAPVVAEDPTE